MSMCMYDGVLLAEPFTTEAKEPRPIMNELSMRGRRVHLRHVRYLRMRFCSSFSNAIVVCVHLLVL